MARIDDLLSKIHSLEKELRETLNNRERSFTLLNGKVIFSEEERRKQKQELQRLLPYLFSIPIRHILTAPFIYILIVPALLLDFFVSLYQTVCFPVYKIQKVKRREYIVLDRHQLPHLNLIEKINCYYCGYVNGLFAYVREVAARTELYWCPIKHTRHGKGRHDYYYRFADYGDCTDLQEHREEQRQWLQKKEPDDS